MSDAAAEQEWVRGAQAGSADAFGRLVRLHQQGLRGFLRRLCGNAAEADDLAQDSFVTAWEKITGLDPARGFRPWLFGIGWRKYREGKRSWLRRMRRDAAAVPDDVAPGDPDLRLDLKAALADQPPEQRAVLLLCLMAGFSHGEAAEALALPLGTVKSHVARGREALVAALEGGSHG